MADSIRFIIAAQPGTYLLWSGIDGEEFWVSKTNVIAWAHIAGDDHLTLEPVTTDGVNDDGDKILPILHPDGRVDIALDRSFDSFEDWKRWAESGLRSKG